MEATGADIGIVVGTMHARYFQLTVTGEPSHVGPTTMDRRRDSLAATAEIILAVERIALAAEPGGRASATWIENIPTRAATSPTSRACTATFGMSRRSVRSPWSRSCATTLDAIATRRRVSIAVDPYATFGPVAFDPALGNLLRDKAQTRQLTTRDMIAAAGHDSVLVAPFVRVPCCSCRASTGSPTIHASLSTKEQVARGAQVLLDAVLELAG